MGAFRAARSSWVFIALLTLWLTAPCVGEEQPKEEAPKPDERWRQEAEELERRAAEAAAKQDHQTALELRRAAVRLISERSPESQELAKALNNAAVSIISLGQVDEAVPLLEEALAMWKRVSQSEGRDVATGHLNLAIAMNSLGRPADALRHHEAAIAIWRQVLPEGHPDMAQGLANLALALGELGRLDDSLPLWQEALGIWKRIHPGDHRDVATGLSNLANALSLLGRAPEALPIYQEALSMWRRLSPGNDLNVALGIQGQAHALWAVGRAAEALRLQDEALAMFQQVFPGDDTDVAVAQNFRAHLLVSLGRPADALAIQGEALAMWRRVHSGDHPRVALGLNDRAHILFTLGRPDEALPLLEEALSMRRRVLPSVHENVAQSLSNLAVALDELCRWAEALPLHEEALAIRRLLYPRDHPHVALGLSNLAMTLISLGRVADSLPIQMEALEMNQRVHPGDHPDVANQLGNLAHTLKLLDRTTEALAHNEEAMAMWRRLHPGDHQSVAHVIGNLAAVLHAAGRPADALPLHDEALLMRRRLFPEYHPDVALSLHNQASSLEALGRVDDAIRVRREACEIGERSNSPARWRWNASLGSTYIRARQMDSAIQPLNRAIGVLEALRSHARGLRPDERSQLLASLRERGDPYAYLIVAHAALGHRVEALEALERGRGRELLDLLLRGRIDPVEQAKALARERGNERSVERIEEAMAECATAEMMLAELARKAEELRTRPSVQLQELRALAVRESQARKAVLDSLSKIQRLVMHEASAGRPLEAAQVQALLRPNEMFLAYSISEVGSYGFVVGPETIVFFEIAVQSLEQLAEEYAEVLAGPDADHVLERGRRLAQALVPEAVWGSVKEARRLYLMPDGALNRIPFEALVVGEKDGKPVYWAEAGPPIAYTPSASVLSWLLTRPRGQGDPPLIVAVGDPIFAGNAPPPMWPKAGVVLTEVRPGGQAERLGLRPGDVLTFYDGAEIADFAALRAAVQGAGEGRDDIALSFVRDGEPREVKAASGMLGVSLAMEAPEVAGPKLLAGGPIGIALRSATERGRRLLPLPGTRTELKGIERALRERHGVKARVQILLGRDATEARLFEATQSPRILHLATHGIADETETASFSSLALTMPTVPVPGDDGFLTLIDLFSRWRGRLEGTELVVLSACDSTKGRLQKAEGMYALPWGFLYAGARAVVGSLWKVDDASTAFLMAEFYRRLLAEDGRDPLGALAAARLATMTKYPHPRYWAAFVFSGAPR